MAANDQLLDAVLRRQVDIRRLTVGQVRTILRAVRRSDRAVSALLMGRLTEEGTRNLSSRQWRELLRDVRDLRSLTLVEIEQALRGDLRELSDMEAEEEEKNLVAALPVLLALKSPKKSDLSKLVTEVPFSAGTQTSRTLRQWWKSVRDADMRRIRDALQLGVAQGETVADIVRRIRGTRANNFSDGILAITLRNVEAVVRTSINHVFNAAREMFWLANAEMFLGSQWVSILDGLTTLICQGRDGAVSLFPGQEAPAGVKLLIPQGARPPAHPNCRSLMAAILSAANIADLMPRRPFIRDARTGKMRERDFRREARRLGVPVRTVRRRWAERNIGSIPADMTYEQWLKTQPRAFQDDVLGPARADLFRDGKVSLPRFVDHSGRTLTLEELRNNGV